MEVTNEGDDNGGIVYVAVGKSIENTIGLLHWTFRNFQDCEVVLLHVHQPSTSIPTLLGKLPTSQAIEQIASEYHRKEKAESDKLLFSYLSICCRAKVKASVITTETGQIHNGIIELAHKLRIKRLVMGAVPENCVKVMKSSSKANYAAKHVPPFCEIWFVSKGKHIWTREASDTLTMLNPNKIAEHKLDLNFRTLKLFDEESVAQNSLYDRFLHTSTSSNVIASSSLEVERERFDDYLLEAKKEADTSKTEAFAEILKCKRLESDASEIFEKVKVFEAAHAREVQLRKETDNALQVTKSKQVKILERREELLRKLQKSNKDVANLDVSAKDITHRLNDVAGELGLLQASLETLRNEKQKISDLKEEAVRCLERWKGHGQVRTSYYSNFCLVNAQENFTRFTSSDLNMATCNFSNSFKIGHGGYGCVYKGEIHGRSVAIKKLHPLNMQGICEFQEEVQNLSKFQHPHLVKVIGACPETFSLVYEYLPNGSIQDHLFRKANTCPLTWETRARIAAEISSALLYLHLYKPVEIIHGDLKPENILLDMEFRCKIGDYGIFRLVSDESARCPSFRGNAEMNYAFPYTDPEFVRSKKLTRKSDVYAFGIIILQLLTGRPPFGLANDVRQAVFFGKLASVLDSSAGEWPVSVAKRLVEIGLKFCQVNSEDRPKMKPTVVWELKRLLPIEERIVPVYFLCPIFQEIMYDPHVAADGFTYEAKALRGWLSKGRETSPMTNLKLSHLYLTPNRALQVAIQDWLCQ